MNQQQRARVYAAQRAGITSRLREAWRLPEDRAEAPVIEWEAEAEQRELAPTDPHFCRLGNAGWLSARIVATVNVSSPTQ